MKIKKPKQQNFVAKYARRFNRTSIHVDRKKNNTKGYRKHKGQDYPLAA